MRPARSILDRAFSYVPAVATSVVETWRRFGWRPTTDDERKRRGHGAAEPVADAASAVIARPTRRGLYAIPMDVRERGRRTHASAGGEAGSASPSREP